MLFDRGHPRFWNFLPIIPIDIVRLKSYVNDLFDSTGVPMSVAVNKFNIVPKRIVSELTETAEVSQFAQALCLCRVPYK